MKNILKNVKLLSALAAVSLCGSYSASALTITNGSFEDGLNGWVEQNGLGGNAFIDNFHDGFTATDGNFFANLQATSYLSQDVQTWVAGDSITFDWAFDANDVLPYNDFSIFTVYDDSFNELDSITLANVASVGDFGQTGWNSYEYTFASSGSGYIEFGSVNLIDSGFDSNLLIDNVVAAPAVPEPSTYAMFGMAFTILGFVGYRSRNRKS